ncbi:killer cell lectin-like receptor subfamily F member 1 isoform X2 [Pleurodeles waltl]
MGDEEGYTSLHFKARKKPEDEGTGVPEADLLSPHWHRPALYFSGALNILLAFAVVGFGVWSLHQAEPEALLCPEGWQFHAGNCYYFSKYTEPKTWSESHEDCSTRGSCLLVIQNKPEL